MRSDPSCHFRTEFIIYLLTYSPYVPIVTWDPEVRTDGIVKGCVPGLGGGPELSRSKKIVNRTFTQVQRLVRLVLEGGRIVSVFELLVIN